LAVQSGTAPAELRRQVTSPGGTTAAGIAVLEDRDARKLFIECVKAAEKRGAELSAV
jgi:pyrroline-5-carboxylate reductase